MTDSAVTITITGPQGSGKTRWADRIGQDSACIRELPRISAVAEHQSNEPLTITVSGDLTARQAWADHLGTFCQDMPVTRLRTTDTPPSNNVGGHEDLGGIATAPSLANLCREIHASNLVAGWWTNLTTGESIVATRNRPEMLMLAVSELAEAAEGIDLRPDDKLPHLCMFDVELGDFVIRQLDQIGAEVSLGVEMPDWRPFCSSPFRARSWNDQLMLLVRIIAGAMEHYRKGRVTEYVQVMANGVMHAFAIAEANGINLSDVIAQKRAFNATRPDHKVENRVKDGGKQF